jgi:ribonuclease HI
LASIFGFFAGKIDYNFSRLELMQMAEAVDEWLLMVDGAARGNPGEAGCGAAVFAADGSLVKELSRYLGRATNNIAEYEGLLMGLEALLQMGAKKIRVQSDSQLLVRQLNGEYRVKDEKLRVLFTKAMKLLRQFDSYRVVHVYREANKVADRLANRGIDQALRQAPTG